MGKKNETVNTHGLKMTGLEQASLMSDAPDMAICYNRETGSVICMEYSKLPTEKPKGYEYINRTGAHMTPQEIADEIKNVLDDNDLIDSIDFSSLPTDDQVEYAETKAHEIVSGGYFKAAVALMDDTIREQLHRDMSDASEEDFLKVYILRHEIKFGEKFSI